MILKPKLGWLSMFLSLKGSILTTIWRRVAFVTIIAILVSELTVLGYLPKETLTALPFSLIGLALSIFLGFRNNTSYDRFWEGRKLWGRLVNTSRSITRQILTLIEPKEDSNEHQRLTYLTIGYVHALRLHLRTERDLSELEPFVGSDRARALVNESNPPIAILQHLGDGFASAWRAGRLDTLHLPVLEASLTEFANIQGGCERIRATPIPFAYTVLMHRIVGIYCLGLPFGLVSTIGMMTPLVVAMIAYAFFALDAIGDEIEDPFGQDANDLPLSQLSRMIEINLRERLGETALPPPVTPEDGVLS